MASSLEVLTSYSEAAQALRRRREFLRRRQRELVMDLLAKGADPEAVATLSHLDLRVLARWVLNNPQGSAVPSATVQTLQRHRLPRSERATTAQEATELRMSDETVLWEDFSEDLGSVEEYLNLYDDD